MTHIKTIQIFIFCGILIHTGDCGGVTSLYYAFSLGESFDNMTITPTIVTKEGYPIETHVVTSTYGYKLTLHRIPCGRKMQDNVADNVTDCPPPNDSSNKRPPVLLQHGIGQSSFHWVSDGRNSLGFFLADAGYDVWMGNFRGNNYSNQHVHYDSLRDKKYWDFSYSSNLKTYGHFHPPHYKIEDITTPFLLVWAKHDDLLNSEDVAKLGRQLKNVVVDIAAVERVDCSHVDFLHGVD